MRRFSDQQYSFFGNSGVGGALLVWLRSSAFDTIGALLP
jgi:hypothetical protein